MSRLHPVRFVLFAATLALLLPLLAPRAEAAASCQGQPVTSGCKVNGTLGPCQGTSAGDVIVGTPGPDVIHARGGHDRVLGRGGKDIICGGGGEDLVFGGGGADSIEGNGGDDDLRGEGGGDRIDGGGGSGDVVNGGKGNDACLDPGFATFWQCEFLDGDNDGFVENEDCDDGDPDVNPDAPERCNGIDDDCDGLIDEDFDLAPQAKQELRDSGLDKYVGQFEPAGEPEDAGGGWDEYTFDTDGGDGPICIAGTPLTVFHQQRASDELLIVLDGGGACNQDFYLCSILADATPPSAGGIFAETFNGFDNPFAGWSKLFVSYCDGSRFLGDNELVDANFPFGPVRFHRGVRNLTAALDLARTLHPEAKKVLLAGIEAGGHGVGGYAPSIYRLVFPPTAKLFALSDSGPSLYNPALGAVIQDDDWQFSQFYPASCTECSPLPASNQGAFIEWTLENDNGYKGALYSTDGDAVERFFTFIPTQAAFRALLLSVHDPINAAHPTRYKRFIRSGSEEHTALGGDGFYTFEADGVPLYQWTEDFVNDDPGWVDIVEDFVPAP